ncbi:MAG: outer membrane beta-barrel protein [Sphingobacterium sp.]
MFIFRFIFVTLLLSIETLSAQSLISGTVQNIAHHTVSSVTVTLKKADGARQASVQSDQKGEFRFTKVDKGEYVIHVTGLGYEPYYGRYTITGDTTLILQIKETERRLEEANVTGSKAMIERSSEKVVYNIGSSIAATGGDALQAIAQLSGVRVINNEITMVGKGVTRIMINNRLVQLQGEDLIQHLKTYAANQIEKIEYISQPSAQYEVDGNAGLINIITKQSKIQGYSGNIQIASKYYVPGESSIYGIKTFGNINGSANLTYNWKKWSFYGSVNHTRGRILEGFQFDVYYPKQHWQQLDTGVYTHNATTAIAGIDYRINSSLNVGASFSGGRDRYDGSDNIRNPIYNLTGGLDSLLTTKAHYHPVALPTSLNTYANIKLDTLGRQLALNADFLNYYRNDVSDFESNAYDNNGNYKPSSKTEYFDRNKQNIKIYTLRANVDWPTSFATISFGSKLSFINEYSNAFYYNKTTDGLVYNTDLSNEFDYRENTQAFYGHMTKTIDKWKLALGLRAELTQTKGYSYTLAKTTTKNYMKLFPTMLTTYTADPENTFSLAIGRRINRPSFWSLNPFKSLYTAYSYGEGNPYLQPEYTLNGELTHTYKSLFRTSLFANRTENGFMNVTVVRPDTNLVYTKPINFITTFRFGFTEAVTVKPTSYWETNLMMSVYHTKASSELNYIKDVSAVGAYLSNTNTIYFNPKKTIAAAINFWYQFPEIDHIGKTARYYKLDLGLKASTANKKWDMTLNLNDAFRSSAMAYAYTVNDIKQTFTNFQIIRYWQLSIGYRFGKGKSSDTARTSGNEEERGRVH